MFEKKRLIAMGIAVMIVAFGTLSGCKKSKPEPKPEPAPAVAPVPAPESVSAGEAIEKAFKDAGKELDEETKAVLAAAKAKAEQTVCPIMGEKINKEISTEYKGQKVYFCCAMCIDTFNKEPEKYLSKLPQFGGK